MTKGAIIVQELEDFVAGIFPENEGYHDLEKLLDRLAAEETFLRVVLSGEEQAALFTLILDANRADVARRIGALSGKLAKIAEIIEGRK